jgi:muramoyltetrapeptide carboxypeptidase
MDSEIQFGRQGGRLTARSTVGVVSLASCVDGEALQAGCARLGEVSGWRVEMSSSALEREGDFAGSVARRADSLMEMWLRSDVDAIVCSRGGYGSNYLLPRLDFDALRAMPKAFVGYSDNTSILLGLDRAGIVSFHGPMVVSDFAKKGMADDGSFLASLRGEAQDFVYSSGSGVRSLIAGRARGSMVGGCLSVVVTSLGTPWEMESRGKIVFLEDVNEKPFRIDRMLRHLLLAGKFEGVRGVVFGAMRGCSASAPEEETLAQVIVRVLGGLGVPMAIGFPSGHVEAGNVTLPFGVPAMLESGEAKVRLRVEAATLRAR